MAKARLQNCQAALVLVALAHFEALLNWFDSLCFHSCILFSVLWPVGRLHY